MNSSRSRPARWAAAVFGLCAVPAMVLAAAAGATEKLPSGPGSVSGVWFSSAFKTFRTGAPTGEPRVRPTADGTLPPMQPATAALVDRRIKDFHAGHPYARPSSYCLPEGIPEMMMPPGQLPIQILETPGQITVLFELLSTFRIIRLNARHEPDPDPTFMGDSVGHWEGDTLVVDTIGLTDRTPVDGLVPHSESLHVVERIRRTGKDTLEDRITIEDPRTFTKPYTYVSALKHVPGEKIVEFLCEENRNPPDASGNTGVQLRSTP